MFFSLFKLPSAVFSKIVFTTALCSALVATIWYQHSFILRLIEWLLSDHKQTVVLGLLFLALLLLQRFLYNTRGFGRDWDPELLHEKLKKESNTNFVESPSSGKSGEFDTILDFVLREVSGHIFGTQKIPDVNKTFQVPMPLGFEPRECHFTATEGKAYHVNFMYRDGESTVCQRADGGLVLSAAVGLRAVSVKYHRYAAHVDMGFLPPIYASGELTGTVSPLTLRVEVLLTPSFSAELHCLRVENMGPLQATVTGLGEWGFMWPTIQEALLPTVQEYLQQQVMERVEPILREGLCQLTNWIAAIPKIRLLPESDGSPKTLGALEMQPGLTLTPSTIAMGGGLAMEVISMLGMGLVAALENPPPRSNDEDE